MAVYWLLISKVAVIMVRAWNIAGHVVNINGVLAIHTVRCNISAVRQMTLLIDHKENRLHSPSDRSICRQMSIVARKSVFIYVS